MVLKKGKLVFKILKSPEKVIYIKCQCGGGGRLQLDFGKCNSEGSGFGVEIEPNARCRQLSHRKAGRLGPMLHTRRLDLAIS